ncbi:hypothetical protein GGF46_001918 [Coemansia sp. RSA 552]|nr:hypothetical protein GGF46_001918 [Coemansia sp. RSA 552]
MYGTYYADRPAHQPQPQPQQQYVPSVYAQPAPAPYTAPSPAAKPFAIDVPSRASGASGHRDSESASSVSSQTTLVDSYSPAAHRPGAKQRPTTVVDGSVCEEDVFAAASILMSLRTCKLPC